MLLKRAKVNDECCVEYSIFASEDGQTYKYPLVEKNGGCLLSYAHRLTLQQWVDLSVSYGYGLCFEGWRHVVQGT